MLKKRKWISLTSIAVLILTCAVFLWAQPPKSDSNELQVSGVKQGNVGCVVLEKHMPVKGPLLALGVIYARTQYKVLATYNAKLPQDKFTGPGEVKELNRLAIQDKLKLVIIHSGYSDAELAQAKQLCQESGASSPAPAVQ
jgi:hypothetical protein